jgi:hypothetical protein
VHGVTGVSFELDSLQDGEEELALRVEFPIELPRGGPYPTTENHPRGSPYWGGHPQYRPSPVKQGFNRFRWADVKSPVEEDYSFDSTKVLAIQFHVPSVSEEKSARRPYSFCIDKLTFLRE